MLDQTLADLESVLKLMREHCVRRVVVHGVFELELDRVAFLDRVIEAQERHGEAAVEAAGASTWSSPGEEKSPLEQMSPEQVLFWSAGGPPVADPGAEAKDNG